MGTIKKDDIRGYHIESEIVCANCATDDEEAGLKEADVITENDADESEDLYFCDRCNKRM